MELEKIKITDINPADYNPRRISDDEFLKLQNSISTFGVVDPIIINLKNNKIIGGHQRYDVLVDQYMKEDNFMEELHLLRLGDVGWVFPDTDLTIKSEDHEKALNLALNKISGEWDEPKLAELLEDLSLSNLDIELTGFDKLELTDMDINLDDSNTSEDYEVVEDEYEAPEDIEVNVEMEDVFKLGNHVLVCGDSTVKEHIDKLLQVGGREIAIDLLLTDPPYGIDIVSSQNKVGGGNTLKFKGNIDGNNWVDASDYKPIINDNSTDTAKKMYETIKEKSTNKIIFGGNYFTDFLPPKPCWVIWDKENTGNFADVEMAWTSFEKAAKLYKWLWNGLCRKGARNIEGKSRVHPTQKPVGLLTDILNDFSKENDNILDLFGGSGSTLIACEQTHRNCYMMELDPYYCQVIINRWEEFTGKKAEKLN